MQAYEIVKVGDKYGKVVCQYTNGTLTTAGLVQEITVVDNSKPITYNSSGAVFLPFNFKERDWLDDRNEIHKVKTLDLSGIDIHCDATLPAYVMDDGHISQTITEVK